MTDALGYRMKFGVLAPSTNTSVQPEFDDMRPVGVTNHFSRIYIPDNPVHNDDDFNKLMDDIRAELLNAVDRVMTCHPDRLVMGMSAETFWDGLEGSIQFQKRVEDRAGVPLVMGSDACRAALKALGDVKRISVVTPYMPVGDKNVARFFTECGYEVVAIKGLKCTSPVMIAHATEREMRDAILEVNSDEVEAIVQTGTNLAMARLAASAEVFLQKPVVAINTATYWHALRSAGIQDKVAGFGSLLERH